MGGDLHYQDRVVRLSELLGNTLPPVIEGFSFDGCHIVGPAVVQLEVTEPGSGVIANCRFDGEPDAIFLQLAAEQEQIIGAIVLRNCSFDGCTFQGIGILDKERTLRDQMFAEAA